MAIDLSKIKGISDDVKAKLAKVKNKDEFDALLKAENLSAEQLKALTGGASDCRTDWFGFGEEDPDYCFGKACKALPL